MNKKGSAMVWAAVSMVIIMILALGIITAGQAYALRSTNESSQKQAYLTARSAVDSVLSQLDGYTATGNSANPSNAYPLIPASGSIYINDFDFPAEMGECTVTVTRESDTVLKVSAAASVGSEVETVCARLLLSVATASAGGSPFSAADTLRGLSVNGTLTVPSASRYFSSTNSDFYVNDVQTIGTAFYSFYLGNGKLFTDISIIGGKLNGHSISYNTGNKQPYETTPLPSNIQLPDTPEDFLATKDNSGGAACYRPDIIWGSDTAAFTVTGDTENIETKIGGTGTYYFKVTAGNTFNLNLITANTPTVYIFLDASTSAGNAELVINGVGSGARLFVVGGPGSKVSTTSSRAITMSGAIAADDISLGGSLQFTYLPPSTCLVTTDAVSSGGSGSVIFYTDTWRFDEYAAE